MSDPEIVALFVFGAGLALTLITAFLAAFAAGLL
jgi:hypothetical protein